MRPLLTEQSAEGFFSVKSVKINFSHANSQVEAHV